MIRVILYMYNGFGLPYTKEVTLAPWVADDPQVVEPFIEAARPGLVRLPLYDGRVLPLWTEDVSGVRAWFDSGFNRGCPHQFGEVVVDRDSLAS